MPSRGSWRTRLREALRFRAAARLPPIFYDRGYAFALPATTADPLRGEKVLAALSLLGVARSGQVESPPPASLRALLSVHERAYLERLADPGPFTRAFGVPLTPVQRDRALVVQRAMTGGTIAAVRRAIAEHGVTVNLGGGFHHARRDRGLGFCLFNDVAAAIAVARRGGFAAPVLVVDLDLHDGDGTRAIFAEDASVYTYSVHNRNWDEPSGVATTAIELGSDVEDGRYLDTLRETLPPLFAAHRPGLVVYLAGCDVAGDDSMGDWRLSAEGILARDRLVLELARGASPPVPVAIVLAGGYGERAWRYTARLLAWLAEGRVPALPPDDEVLMARYRALARLLSPAELTGAGADASKEDDWGLSEEDLLGLQSGQPETRFLGYYTAHGVELVLETTGIFDRLRDLGYAHPRLELDLERPGEHTVRIWGGRHGGELLAEMRARRDRQLLPGFELLAVEWLLLQNPRARFTAERPPLPGQRHPGLGMLPDVIALLVQVCDRLHLDGVAFTPSHYHLTSQSSKYLRFREPRDAATFDALAEAVAGVPLGEATRLVEGGGVADAATGTTFRWRPMPMVLVVSDALAAWFAEQRYEERRAEARAALRLRIG